MPHGKDTSPEAECRRLQRALKRAEVDLRLAHHEIERLRRHLGACQATIKHLREAGKDEEP